MADIFVVTEGSYSDYRIVAVFDTRDRAEAYVAGCDALSRHAYKDGQWEAYGAELEIEVYPLNEPPAEPERTWYVRIRADGVVVQATFVPIAWIGKAWSAPGGPYREPGWGKYDAFIGTGESPEYARRQAEDFRRAWLTRPREVTQ